VKKKDLLVVALATFCLTTTISMIVPIKSDDPNWDPWADIREDGIVDIYDAITLANAYGTSGTTPRNVNVMNWPASTQETVFYQQSTGGYSKLYNASGFGHVHVLWDVSGLAGSENVTIRGFSEIHEPGGSGYYTTHFIIVVATIDNVEGSSSFSVPGEFFGFHLAFAVGTTASVNLAYYLTYA
jgi:hypothetical protein